MPFSILLIDHPPLPTLQPPHLWFCGSTLSQMKFHILGYVSLLHTAPQPEPCGIADVSKKNLPVVGILKLNGEGCPHSAALIKCRRLPESIT
jgi:hypothetical protein